MDIHSSIIYFVYSLILICFYSWAFHEPLTITDTIGCVYVLASVIANKAILTILFYKNCFFQAVKHSNKIVLLSLTLNDIALNEKKSLNQCSPIFFIQYLQKIWHL